MRVVFFGTAPFGLPSLQAVADHPDHELVGIVTGPDKGRGRGRSVSPTPVGRWAADAGFAPVFKPARLRDREFPATLRGLAPDVFLVIAYRILPEAIFTLPEYAFNLHASLLPAYRGAAPVQRALMAGETETGVTTFLLQKTVDTGGILDARRLMIDPQENAGELTARLADLGRDLVIATLARLSRGDAATTPQDDARASAAPKLGPEDQILRFNRPAQTLVNHVRAMAPRPGTQAMFQGRQARITKLAVLEDIVSSTAVPGTVVRVSGKTGLAVKTADNAVAIVEIQPEGKKPQTGAEFVRGYRVALGDRFEECV